MIVYKNPQRQWLSGAEQELAQRLQERASLDQRILQLQQIIAALKPVLEGQEDTSDISLPQLCLRVLSFSGNVYQSVPQVRSGLKAIGVEVPGGNPLAILHTVLGRLAGSNYAEAHSPKPGAPVHYRITTAGRLALQGS